MIDGCPDVDVVASVDVELDVEIATDLCNCRRGLRTCERAFGVNEVAALALPSAPRAGSEPEGSEGRRGAEGAAPIGVELLRGVVEVILRL